MKVGDKKYLCCPFCFVTSKDEFIGTTSLGEFVVLCSSCGQKFLT